ncbi:MAG: matrixin family metalloprotease [Paludibacteraceae bacterium]|nr:matrixin family metalloprotease [Paludibacteraceae bacterium]
MKSKNYLLGISLLLSLSACEKNDVNLDNIDSETIASEGNEISLMNDMIFPESDLRSCIYKANKWSNGEHIPYKFLSGSATQKKKFKSFLNEWMAYANLYFYEVPASSNATVRVQFDNSNSSASYVGTDAKYITNQSQWTVHFGWLKDNTAQNEYSRVILHELGHVLGLKHEHQSPASPIIWDEDKVYEWGKNTQGWSASQTYSNVIKKYTASETNYSSYDPNSIMTYGMDARYTKNGITVKTNRELSSMDKSWMKQWYPFNGTKRLFRCYFPDWGRHFYTTNFDELKKINKGETVESLLGKVYETQVSGTTKLYRYWNSKTADHFYTTNYNELGGGKGNYVYEHVEGYVYSSKKDNTLPLYRYYNSKTGEHFYTTNYNEIKDGKSLNFKYEGIACYILPN